MSQYQITGIICYSLTDQGGQHVTNRLQWPPCLLVDEYQGSFPRIKTTMHKADHSPPSTAEVNSGAIPPLTHMPS
jgi:hypothetical protein